MNGKTQNDAILEHLKAGKPITPLEALSLYGCFRLGARCFELKQQGHAIISKMVEINGKRVAEYRLC